MVVYLASRQLLFVHPPRTGGTSVEWALAQSAEPGDLVVGGLTGARAAESEQELAFGLAKHASLKEALAALAIDQGEVEVVCTVRHPLRQLASAWRFCAHQIQISAGSRGLSVRELLDPGVDALTDWPFDFPLTPPALKAMADGSKFDGFARRVLEDGSWRWLQQSSYLTVDGRTAPRLQPLKQETLREDWAALARRHGLAATLPQLAPTGSDPHTRWPARQLSRRTLEAASVLAPEIALLGYAGLDA